ncbi:unnamed protein product [Urochloa humidicola]
MPSSSGAGETITLPADDANAPVAAMDAKLMVSTGSGDVQQLKDLVKNEDSKMIVVVMAKQSASAEKPHQGNIMDPHLLALASSGNCEGLRSLLNLRREDGQACANNSTNGSLPVRRGYQESTLERVTSEGAVAIHCCPQASDDIEANESILMGVTAQGDTAMHVVATCGQGDNFFTRSGEAKHLLLQNNINRRRRPTRAERDALTTYGEGDNFLESARIIHKEARRLLFEPNKNGDTPLHSAAGAGKSNMVACLIDLALKEEGGENRVKELLRKGNNHKETALHQAVRTGNKRIVDLLMEKDSELAKFPEDGGASPLYLAIVLKQHSIVDTLISKGHGELSFSGLEVGLGPCRAGTARPSRVSCRIMLGLLGTLGTSCHAGMARYVFYSAQARPMARRHAFVPC